MSNTPEVDPKSPTGDEQAEDETTEERPADPEASRVLADRWSAWQGGDDETASGDPRAERREHAAEKADEKRARAQAREMEKELARAEREERARTRREHKDIARSQAIVEHDIRVDQVKGLVKDARRSLIVFHEQGVIGVVRAVFGRRWVVVVSLCLLVVLSALTGALVMRARHRRHLTAVLVAINGTTIKRNDLSDELLNVYGRQTLDGLVQRELRRQFLVKHGAVASEKQVSERLQLESGLPDFMPILQRAGKSESEYRKSLARSLSELNLISKAVTLTDAEIREFYERNADPRNARALFHTPDVVTLAVICTPDKRSAQQARSAVDGGADWAAVARRLSVDDTGQQGGLMEPFALGRSLSAHAKGLDSVARQIQAGQQAGPIQVNGLWWLVRCLERRPAQTRPFDEVKETVRILARAAKGEQVNGKRLAQEYEAFKKKASIQTFSMQ